MAVSRLARLVLAASAVALTSLAARAEELTVYWNPGHSYDAYAKVIKQFEADHPGWTVNWEKLQWPDMRTKLIADFAVGNVPDLSAEPGGWVEEFGQEGLLRPLNEDGACSTPGGNGRRRSPTRSSRCRSSISSSISSTRSWSSCGRASTPGSR